MSTKSVLGALAAGMVVGAVAGIMFDPINDRTHKKIQKNTSNMFKTIGSIVDDIMSM